VPFDPRNLCRLAFFHEELAGDPLNRLSLAKTSSRVACSRDGASGIRVDHQVAKVAGLIPPHDCLDGGNLGVKGGLATS